MTASNSFPVATSGYTYEHGRLLCRGVDINQLADQVGTPCFIYDAQGIRDRCRSLQQALSPLRAQIRYAIKANGNLSLLRIIAQSGCGMDAVSIGEVERAFLAGVPMEQICFAGVAKGDDELRAALDGRFSPIADEAHRLCGRQTLDRGPVGLFNVESLSELQRLSDIASELDTTAQVAIRVNPGITAGANDKVRVGSATSKFGLLPEAAFQAALLCGKLPGLHCRGLHMHIGSQIHEVQRFGDALVVMLRVLDQLSDAGVQCDTLDVGAGVAVSSMGEPAPTDTEYAAVLIEHLADRVARGLRVITEPGREIVAQSGVLLTRVRHVKSTPSRTFVVTDAGLNALIRPALYNADHLVWPVVCDPEHTPSPIAAPSHAKNGLVPVDIVGPVCESSDIIGRDRPMPRIERGDVLAIFTAGAYAMSMAMTYNDHPLPAEALIDNDVATLIRAHQPYAELYAPTAMSACKLDVSAFSSTGIPA